MPQQINFNFIEFYKRPYSIYFSRYPSVLLHIPLLGLLLLLTSLLLEGHVCLRAFTKPFHVRVVLDTQPLKAGLQRTYLISNMNALKINSLMIMISVVCMRHIPYRIHYSSIFLPDCDSGLEGCGIFKRKRVMLGGPSSFWPGHISIYFVLPNRRHNVCSCLVSLLPTTPTIFSLQNSLDS